MNSERNIIKKLFENKMKDEVELEEAGFDDGGNHYSCAFGKYYKNGEEINREEYFKAKGEDTDSSNNSSKHAPSTSYSGFSGFSYNDSAGYAGAEDFEDGSKPQIAHHEFEGGAQITAIADGRGVEIEFRESEDDYDGVSYFFYTNPDKEDTLYVADEVMRKISRMSSSEASNYLDDNADDVA